MEQEASTSKTTDVEGDLVDRITDSLRTTIAAEVRKALQGSKREFSLLAAEACSTNLDALAARAAKKARVDMPDFKRKGTKNQYFHNRGVLDEVESALVALGSNDVEQAKENINTGKKLLLKRLKAIKIADREEFGWAVVRHSDEIASDTEDEKDISRAKTARLIPRELLETEVDD